MAINKRLNNDELVEIYRLICIIRQSADVVHRCRDYELRKYGISAEQSAALICIYSMGNKATSAEIARWLFREPNSVTILLRRMEEMKLIKKKADLKRKNLIRISLTKKGHDAYKHAIEFQSVYFINRVLPERKRKQLWSLLQAIRDKAFDNLRLDVSTYSSSFEKAVIDSDNSNFDH